MTELSQQINRIRSQNLLSVAPLSQGRPSLFLSAKDAAGVDIDQVYDAALNGLKILCQYDGRLAAFQDGLLHSSSMTVQRELKTAAENQCLDKEIALLLEHLSIFATEPSAHLVLEYLIRRYRIHEFNCDSLLRCLISTHDSKIFARAVQLCSISGTVWAFLEGVKNSGSPLPRSVIVSRCLRDTALLNTICQVSRSALALLSIDGNNKPKTAVIAGADRILSFLTATVIELADKGSLNDAQLRILYPFLVEGLKKSTEGSDEGKNSGNKIVFRAGGPADQWRRSSCMIIAQICRKTKLAKPLLKTLVGSLMSAFVSISGVTSGVSSGAAPRGSNSVLDAAVEVVTIVAIVAQTQKVTMGPKMLMAIFSDISASSNSSIQTVGPEDSAVPAARVGSAYILQCIEILQKEKGFDTTALFKVLTTTLTAALVTNIAEEMKNDPRYLSPMMASKILAYCITSGLLADSIIGSIVWTILQNNSLLGHIGSGALLVPQASTGNGRRPRAESFSDDNDGDRKEVLRVLRCVSQRYPSIFDSCVQTAYKAVAADSNGGEFIPETTKMAVDEDDKDDEEDMQVGQSLAEIAAEKLAKATLLRQLLSDTFTDAPYRMPSDTGVSLMLSLNSTSPLLRVQALETFSVTLPDVCESTPDVKGLAQAASLSLTDSDPIVALAAWESPVVSRIACHVSPQDLLESAVTAFNWWAGCMSRVPIRASKVLSVMLATLADKTVASAVCSAQTRAFGPLMKGSTWLYLTVVTCGIDAIAPSLKEEKVAGAEKKARALQINALACAKLLGETGTHGMFRGTVDESLPPKTALAACVASSLSGDDLSAQFEALHTSSLYFLSNGGESLMDRHNASTYISFLDTVSKHLVSSNAVLALQLCSALITSMIARYIRISDSTGSKVSGAVLTALMNLISNCKVADLSGSSELQADLNNVADLIQEASKNILSSELGGRLLLIILGSNDPSVAALVGPCLGQFYGKNPISVLFRVALSPLRKTDTAPDDTRLFWPLKGTGEVIEGGVLSKAVLQVTTHARSSAVTAIAQFVSALNTGNTGADVSASQSALLVAVAPIAIGACCDEGEVLRNAGLFLAKALSELRPALKLFSQGNSRMIQEDGQTAHSTPMTTTELILLGEYLHSASGIILNDPLAAPALLAKKVFAESAPATVLTPAAPSTSSAKKVPVRSQVLADSLLSLATLYGWGKAFISIPIMTAASAAPLESIWKYVETLLMHQTGTENDSSRLSNAVMRCLSTVHEANAEVQNEVVKSFCTLISTSGTDDAHIRNDVLKVLGEGWAMGCSNVHRSELFSALLTEQVRQPGREEILLAIQNIPIDLSTAAVLIEEGSAAFLVAYKQSSPVAIEEDSSIISAVVSAFEVGSQGKRFEDEEETSIIPSGMSRALQCFCSIVEGLHTVLTSDKVMEEVEAAYMRTVVASLLNVFRCLNDKRLRALLAVEYAKTLVADTAHSCLAAASSCDATALFSTGKKSKKDKKADKNEIIFDQARVAIDVEQVLLCLGSARSLQLQKASLRLLRALILLSPETVTLSVEVLGSLLASPSISAHLLAEGQDSNNDGLVSEILSTLVTAMPEKIGMEVEGARNVQFLPQDILQPLCARFLSVPASRRSSLLRMAMSALGPCALPACTSVLLAHALSAYDPEGDTPQTLGTESAPQAQGGLILLSRSSQRKASRSLKSSQPEELFRLAMDSVLTKSAEAQVGALVALVKSVQQLLKFAASSVLTHEEDGEDTGELILVEIEGVGEMLLDVAKSQEYSEGLLATRQKERDSGKEPVDVDRKGTATASLLLQLEFVFEVLENKTFHRQLLPLIEAESGSDTLQSYFLELSEQVLQLLALSTRAQSSANAGTSAQDGEKKKHVQSYLSVQLGESSVEITVESLGKSVGTWCLEILRATQKVLDAPSFVAILQELLSHEDPSVRQTALQILSRRLLAMSQGKRPGAEERALFLDLTSHLRAAVRGCLTPCTPSEDEEKDTDQDRLGIAQSALMCLDILAKYLGSSPNWTVTLADTLAEVVTFSTQVVGTIESTDVLRSSTPSLPVPVTATPAKAKKSKKADKAEASLSISEAITQASIAAARQSYPELLKLQGSVFLSAGTICGTVGPRGLPFLGELLENILSTVENQGAQLLADEKLRNILLEAQRAAGLEELDEDAMIISEPETQDPLADVTSFNYSVHRSRLMLLRSSVNSLTTIMAELPSFFHPYILRTLSATLVLRCINANRRKADFEARKSTEEASNKKSKMQKKKAAFATRNEKQLSKEDVAKQAAEVHSNEIKALCDDIDRCLTVMSSAIPPRLSVPILLQGASSILRLSHGVAEKFATLLGSVWGNLDRPTVLQHITPLSSLATLALDYRRAYGDQGEAAAEVDLAASDAVVQLCLKLTESELKALLARMAEWRDFERVGSMEDDVTKDESSWQMYSRGVSFYHLISQLSARLKSIFLPSMGLIWTDAVSSLKALTEHSVEASQQRVDRLLLGDLSGKKSKKRKSEDDSAEESPEQISQRRMFSELVLRSEHVLHSVKSACVYDSEGFIDETRYGLMMPVTADLIGLRDAFSCDSDYLIFVERHVCSCLSALARAVGRDVLWKPLNHRVLLLTRDSRKSVRTAAVKALHKLFIEVGEEYLLLLPECLPFLSELLEDDAADVTAQTGELIRYIEELSGEKLDAYLQ